MYSVAPDDVYDVGFGSALGEAAVDISQEWSNGALDGADVGKSDGASDVRCWSWWSSQWS